MLSRGVAVVYALWLALVLAEPAAIHACPMHDTVHGAAHSHARHNAGVVRENGAHSSHRDAEPKPCTCVGACCATVAVVVPTCSALVAARTRLLPVHALQFHASEHRPLAVEYARPPTIGPPAPTV